jgi:hypothetical protein
MLLLLLPQLKQGRLRDFYEIRQGVTVSQSPGKGLYKAINLSGIDACTKMIDENKLVSYDPVREVGSDKLLANTDYLVSGKGEVKGYSLLDAGEFIHNLTLNGSCKGIVASNHFLVLRPRDISGSNMDEIRFAHNLLDILVPEFYKIASVKAGNSKFLTINDLGDLKISHPWSDSDFFRQYSDIMTRYIQKQQELNVVKIELDNFNRDLASRVNLESAFNV